MKKIQYGESKNVVGERVRCIRTAKRLTQAQLAARLQTLGVAIDQQMLSRVEHGDRLVTDYELGCLCRALETSPTELLQDFLDTFSD